MEKYYIMQKFSGKLHIWKPHTPSVSFLHNQNRDKPTMSRLKKCYIAWESVKKKKD